MNSVILTVYYGSTQIPLHINSLYVAPDVVTAEPAAHS